MAIRARLDVRDAARARGVDRRRAVPGRATLELPHPGLARAGTRMAGQLGPPAPAPPPRGVHAASAPDGPAGGPATPLRPAPGRGRHPEFTGYPMSRIPRLFRFVFGLREQREPFHLVFYLCLASCRAVARPERMYFYYHHEPWGRYWELAKGFLTPVHVPLEPF